MYTTPGSYFNVSDSVIHIDCTFYPKDQFFGSIPEPVNSQGIYNTRKQRIISRMKTPIIVQAQQQLGWFELYAGGIQTKKLTKKGKILL